jgi:hypothetical protein
MAMAGLGSVTSIPFGVGWFLTPKVALAFVAGVVGSAPIVPAASRWCEAAWRHRPSTIEAAATAALALVFAAAALQIAGRSYDPFIYFRF